MYRLLIVFFYACINLVQFTWPNAFYQFMKQAHSFSPGSKVCSDIILTILFASQVPFSLLNPNWSSTTSSIFHSVHKYPHYYLCCMCDEADCAIFAAFFSYWLFQGNHFDCSEIFGSLSSLICVVDQLCSKFETIYLQFEYTSRYIISCSVVIPDLLDSFFPLPCARYKALSHLYLLPLQVQHLGFLVN